MQELFVYYKTPNAENSNWGYVLGPHPNSGISPHVYAGTTDLSNSTIKWFQQCLTGPQIGKWWPLSGMNVQAVGSACSACSVGKFSNTQNAPVCTPCPVDTFSDTKASMCTPCIANSNSNSSEQRTHCLCNPGWTAAQTVAGANKKCEQCAAGKTKHATGDEACSNCENVKTIDNMLTCVDVVSFRLFLTELSADQHVALQDSIARQFGLSPSMVEIRIVPVGSRRLLSQPFAVDIIVSVPNNDASGASTPPTPSMRNIYQGLAEDQFVSATMLIDGGTDAVHLTPGFAPNMQLRMVLDTNIGGSWSAGDKVVVYVNRQPGINNVVLTYVGETGDHAVGRWSPVNCEPLLESNSTYLFFLKGGQINLYMSK